MSTHLQIPKNLKLNSDFTISGSKSESNRLLILQQLFQNLKIENLSDSDDTQILQHILKKTSNFADVHHAGTVMRFLTAFFACKNGKEIILKGSERMHNRPIKILVDTLRELGAKIEYLEKDGFPPIKIFGRNIAKQEVSIKGNVSSQYISALLLVAPSLPNGLKINLVDEITSVPYIEMTLQLLRKIGVKTEFRDNVIQVFPKEEIENQTLVVESDWSSASYWYSVVALSNIGTEITLSEYKKQSLQGDSSLVKIYKNFGVSTLFLNNKIILKKERDHTATLVSLNLKTVPDIAQTIAVTCLGLEIPCKLIGLQTLKIKETDRLVALKVELEKFGAKVKISQDSLKLKILGPPSENILVKTYNDHRMAMAFAPLSLKIPLTILNPEVVSKSYPNFWLDFSSVTKQK